MTRPIVSYVRLLEDSKATGVLSRSGMCEELGGTYFIKKNK